MSLLVAGFVAGLLGSPHCVGMCGGFAAAGRTRADAWAWHLGRASTYVVLGGLIGSAGQFVLYWGPLGTALTVAALLVSTLHLAGVRLPRVPGLPDLHGPVARGGAVLLRRGGLVARAGFGALTALLPCGLLWTALALASTGGSPLAGALTMAGFAAGGVPALAVASGMVRRLSHAHPWARPAAAVLVFAAGITSILVRSELRAEEAGACHAPATP